MPKKMLINALHAEEARVAIVEDGQLMDLGIEIAGREQTRGNVYKGTVVRVEPGLQAAFIDIGLKKLGFLQMGELHPEFWQWREDVPQENRNRRPRIQEVLRRGQELIVQVEKGERDMKGAAVTSYLSLPGRYMVLMPGSDSAGISRKVEAEGERKKLKEMAAELQIPEGIGYIIRTEALGKKQTELAKDFHYLLKLNESIREAAARVKGPALIYQESDLIIRTIRDYFTSEIDEVLVDSPEVYEQARAFFKEVMPRMASRVKLHQEKRPIFSRYQLEEQIDQIYEKKVPLKSGGSLVIEPAEALVSIDVNSGKSTGEKGIEDTAFKTNLEAAEEAARQLRLRDLGGLIVIDFIDMRDRKHIAEVEKALKHALKSDKARVTVGKISQFGLLEMTRQRIRQTANEAVYLECPHCEGRGRLKSTEAMALSFLRKVHAAAAKGTLSEVRGGLPLEVAYYLLNRKKRDLARIEAEYDIEVTIKGKPSFLMNQIELELIKREKGVSDGQAEAALVPLVAPVFAPELEEDAEPEQSAETAETPAPVPGDEAQPPAEPGKKRKRRRGKKKPVSGETPVEEDAGSDKDGISEEEPDEEDTGVDTSAEQADSGSLAEAIPGSAPKKRKRRRKKGKSIASSTVTEDATVSEAEAAGVEETGAADAHETGTVVGEAAESGVDAGGIGEEVKKKRRRKRRGGAKRRSAEGSSPENAPSTETLPPPAEPEVNSAPPSASTTGQPDRLPETGADPTVPEPAKKPRSPRPRKKPADAPSSELPQEVSSAEAPTAVTEVSADTPPKRSRSPRKPAAPKKQPVDNPLPEQADTGATGDSTVATKTKRPLRKSPPAASTPVTETSSPVPSGDNPGEPQKPGRKKKAASSAKGTGDQ